MDRLAKQAWKWTLVVVTLMLTFGHAFSFAETVILRTTIPRQDELRVKKGVVGNRDVNGDGVITPADGDWNYKDVELTDDNLIVGGKLGIGTDTPNAALQVNGAITRQGSTVSGGSIDTHVNLGESSTIGGSKNSRSTIGGGYNNSITSTGGYSCWSNIIAGGISNKILADTNHTLYATIGGGGGNEITSNGMEGSTIAGGYFNKMNNASGSVIGGGYRNKILSFLGNYSVIPGGYFNEANGYFGFAAGYRARVVHQGSFVWRGYNGSTTTYYESQGNGTFNINAPGGAFLDGTSAWQDVAEYMNILEKEDIKEAELVSLIGKDLLGRTRTAYDEGLIGVISSKRTMTLHLGTTTPPEEGIERLPVALVGRCFVKVTDEEGPIKIGDAITSSSIPGVGMKAAKSCKIIGYAMQNEDFEDEEIKEVLVFVNTGYYVSSNDFKKLGEIEKLKERVKRLEETSRV
ncbi:MAG: hypothetical protein KKC50_05355 [Candidatus Omnitrophica bacterium]|nr:hypothetical protein [Candidatus Omnitrophota bacterium]